MMDLGRIADGALRNHPNRVAIEDRDAAITYENLHREASNSSQKLLANGIVPGDRIGVYARKSIETVVAILGILKSKACYVPVGIDSPPPRNLYIFADCAVKSIILEDTFMPVLESCGFKVNVIANLSQNLLLVKGPEVQTTSSKIEDDLAYILYTSGSTGNPKGVMVSHKSALAFIRWCAETLPFSDHDRFSSHAPFLFDLSIFDLYVCFSKGGTLILIDEDTAKNPLELAKLIAEKQISIWYSTPSVLSLLTQYGKLDKYDYSGLRTVLFAGEVFPIKHLKTLVSLWKHARFFNLYGPTETNVCTYFEVPVPIPEKQARPFPIGESCSHLRCKALDDHGREVGPTERGELCVTGEIMSGYWNLPEKTAAAYFVDSSNTRWYRTGDVVEQDDQGNFIYIGRLDRMVKRRGYRIELGEIEATLYKHPSVSEAAVIALPNQDGEMQIKAYVKVADPGQASLIQMKQFAAESLPTYMIPDRFIFVRSIPKTKTDKIDYQELARI